MSNSITSVGDLFDPEHTHYDIEGAQWRLAAEPLMEIMALDDHDSDGNPVPFQVLKIHAQLLLFHPRPTEAEIAHLDSKATPMKFALTAGQHAMMLSYQFGGGLWNDASWQATRQSMAAGLPDTQGKFHLPVLVALIDSATGILRAARPITWPPEFTAAVRNAIATQESYGPRMTPQARLHAGAAEIHQWLKDYSTPDQLVAEADMVVRGGKDAKVLRNRTGG